MCGPAAMPTWHRPQAGSPQPGRGDMTGGARRRRRRCAFRLDIIIDVGDMSGSQTPPDDEEGEEVVRQYAASTKHPREHFCNLVGNYARRASMNLSNGGWTRSVRIPNRRRSGSPTDIPSESPRRRACRSGPRSDCPTAGPADSRSAKGAERHTIRASRSTSAEGRRSLFPVRYRP